MRRSLHPQRFTLGADGNILEEKPKNCKVLKINNPILTNTDLLKD
ncbi:MAG: glutamate synthase central domain-containing protein [Dorea sp.]